MEYEVELTRQGWTVWRKVELTATQVATYIYESDARYIADELNDHSATEV